MQTTAKSSHYLPMGSRGYRTHFCSDISLFYVFDAPLQITYVVVVPWICQTFFRTTHRRHHCNTQHLSLPPFWHQRCAINRTWHLTELHSHDSIAWNNICYHIHRQHHGDQTRGTIANEISHSCFIELSDMFWDHTLKTPWQHTTFLIICVLTSALCHPWHTKPYLITVRWLDCILVTQLTLIVFRSIVGNTIDIRWLQVGVYDTQEQLFIFHVCILWHCSDLIWLCYAPPMVTNKFCYYIRLRCIKGSGCFNTIAPMNKCAS